MAKRRARIEQSRSEVERCFVEFNAWLDRRRAADPVGRYASQLRSVEQMVAESLQLMRNELDAVDPGGSLREAYRACRQVDRQLVWVRRLWEYFRSRWDQRDDPVRGQLLAAADEVVWSCYSPPFRQLGISEGPAPLPFLSSDFSPRAIPRRRPPQSLRPSDALLMKTLAQLPVPVVGLPEICVAYPWWLILVAHEVGHQVAYELDAGEMPARLGISLGDAASEAAGPPLPQADWSTWAHELFADAYAAVLVGSAHVWMLNELEQGSDGELVKPLPGYPPPIVRQAVSAALLRRLGLDREEELPTVPAPPAVSEMVLESADREQTHRLLEAVPAIVTVLIEEPIIGSSTLTDLVGCKPQRISRSGKAGGWQRELAGAADIRPEAELDAARLATVGALAEWEATMAEPDEGLRRERIERLRRRMLEVVPHCREEGARAETEAAGTDVADLAHEVAQEIRNLPLQEEGPPFVLEFAGAPGL